MALASDLECQPVRGEDSSQHDYIANLIRVAAIAVAGYNAYKAYDIAKAEWDMAKRHWQIAKDWLDYYRDYYAPVEDQELAEARALKKEEPDYETARGRARTTAWLAFKSKVTDAVRPTSRYATGRRQDILMELTSAQGAAVALADGLGYRNERAYVQSRDDVRFQKIMSVLHRGRDMASDNVSLARETANIYGDQWDQTMKGLNAAGRTLGYLNNRNPTQYPAMSMGMVVGGAAGSMGGYVMNGVPYEAGAASAASNVPMVTAEAMRMNTFWEDMDRTQVTLNDWNKYNQYENHNVPGLTGSGGQTGIDFSDTSVVPKQFNLSF